MPQPLRQFYRNPPLLEAVVAFQFRPGARTWDTVFFGKIHQEIEDRFPEVETLYSAEFEVNLTERGSASLRTGHELKRFTTSDRGMIITVGPGMLGVSVLPRQRTGGHPGWESLFETARHVLRIYEEVVAPAGIDQIGVRYINSLTQPLQGFVLGTLVADDTGLIPSRLLEERDSFSFRYEHIIGSGSDFVHREVLQLVAQPTQEGVAQFVLDIDEIWQAREDANPDVEAIGDMLHDSVYQLFEGMLRPDVRAMFRPMNRTQEAHE